jgi:hypothetical protein
VGEVVRFSDATPKALDAALEDNDVDAFGLPTRDIKPGQYRTGRGWCGAIRAGFQAVEPYSTRWLIRSAQIFKPRSPLCYSCATSLPPDVRKLGVTQEARSSAQALGPTGIEANTRYAISALEKEPGRDLRTSIQRCDRDFRSTYGRAIL